jgi:hypothetical protein
MTAANTEMMASRGMADSTDTEAGHRPTLEDAAEDTDTRTKQLQTRFLLFRFYFCLIESFSFFSKHVSCFKLQNRKVLLM